MTRQTRRTVVALCFLLPNFLGFLTFTVGPVVFSLAASFTNWNLMKTVPLRCVWFDNYVKLITEPEFWLYFINTAYLMLGMPIAIAGSLFLAVLISQRLRGMVVYRTLFYLPSFTAGVALLILWKALYNPTFGPINLLLEWVFDGVGLVQLEPPDWLASTKNLLALAVERVEIVSRQFGLGARDALIIMGIWTAIGGGNMLLYLAGISNIRGTCMRRRRLTGPGIGRSFAMSRGRNWRRRRSSSSS